MAANIKNEWSEGSMNTNAESVTVVITGTIKPGKVEMARRELETVIETVMSEEPACRGIRVHEDPDNPQRLLIIENWDSKEIFNGPHMQTPHMQAFFKKAEEFLDGQAEFDFWHKTITTF